MENKTWTEIAKELDAILPETIVDLVNMPMDLLEFIDHARPYVGGEKRDFNLTPFWIDIYNDDSPNLMMVAGRQTFKTTYCADVLAHAVTSEPNKEATYVTDNEPHLSAFSRQRFRYQTFKQNPLLRQFLRHDRANIGEISLINNSVAYLVTDESEYGKVEGKSNKLLILDEAQYQDLQFLPKAMYSLFMTKGKIQILGIGGEAGSEYHRMWNRTDQREWIYEDEKWRDKLRFGGRGEIMNTPEELASILKGRWKALNPGATYRGYHLPQQIFPQIPLTIDSAINQYRTQADISIEHQKLYTHPSFYDAHVEGIFYKAPRRPITPEMVYACMKPYNYLELLTGAEVQFLKAVFASEIRILMGVDFGSTPKRSSTFVCIMIHWRKSHRYQIVHIENVSQRHDHQLDQTGRVAQLGHDYNVDLGVGDLGYGAIQVDVIREGGRDSKDNKILGLGKKRFVGCRTIGDETKEQQEFKTEVDEHGKQSGRIQIDKTTSIQKFVDFMGWHVSHPLFPEDESLKRPKLMIPYKTPHLVDFLVEDLCATTRKDIPKSEDEKEDDPRQRARREFNHPRDSMMSIIYCLTADERYDEDAFKILGVKRTH